MEVPRERYVSTAAAHATHEFYETLTERSAPRDVFVAAEVFMIIDAIPFRYQNITQMTAGGEHTWVTTRYGGGFEQANFEIKIYWQWF